MTGGLSKRGMRSGLDFSGGTSTRDFETGATVVDEEEGATAAGDAAGVAELEGEPPVVCATEADPNKASAPRSISAWLSDLLLVITHLNPGPGTATVLLSENPQRSCSSVRRHKQRRIPLRGTNKPLDAVELFYELQFQKVFRVN